MDAAELPALPDGWAWTALGSITDTTRKRVNPKNYPLSQFIGMENVEAHTMRLLGTTPASEMNSTAEYFSAGDVLYGRLRPYLNKVYRPNFDGLCSSEFIPFRNVKGVDNQYLQYFLNSWDFVQFASSLNTGDRPRISFSQLANYPFPLAPLSIQHGIVVKIEELFSQLDAAEAALKRAKANLVRYRQSVLQAAVTGELTRGWREAHAGQIEPASVLLERIRTERRTKWEADLRARGKDPSKVKYEEPAAPDTSTLSDLPEGWVWVNLDQISEHRLGKMLDKEKNKGTLRPYLRNANVRWFSFDMTDVYQIRVADDELENISAISGDLIICEGGEPGRCAIWMDSTPVVLQKALHRVRLSNPATSSFLAMSLMYDSITGRLEKYFTGSTIKHFTGESLGNYSFALPPIMEQTVIISKFEEILSIIVSSNDSIDSEIRKISILRQSILQRAFCGQLIN